MKKVSSRGVDAKLEVDRAKKVYRAAVDTIRRIDEKTKKKKAYKDIFSAEAVGLRQRLQEYCERLMFFEPVEYGRRAEELLWRKVYYDIIQLMKHNRKQMKPNRTLESAFRTHLVGAAGYYHHLLFKLQQDFMLRLDGIVDVHLFAEPKSHKKPLANKKEVNEATVDWATKACHRCLVYLGDIARYHQDYDTLGVKSACLSQRYYHQALALLPDSGMPHNQLGTLAGGRYYNVDAAYHYLRCICAMNSFDGARGNLSRLLEKNRRRHAELSQKSPRDLPPDQQRSKDIKRFLVRFMHLVDIFHTADVKLEPRELQEACQSCLQDFNLCMFYAAPPQDSALGYMDEDVMLPDDKAAHLSDEMIFKVVVICQMLCFQLQKKGSKTVTAAIAFSLALFSHVLNHVVIRLQAALYELENPHKHLDADNMDEKVLTDTTDCESVAKSDDLLDDIDDRGSSRLSEDELKEDIEKIEKRRKKLSKIRYRRRRRHDSDTTGESPTMALSLSDDSDLSEGGADVDHSDSDSDSGDGLQLRNYATRDSDSSDSDSDTDNLMVSQELRPGFSGGDLLSGGVGWSREKNNNHNGSTSNNTSPTLPNNVPNGLSQADVLADMTEYLQDFPTDLLLDSSSFFSQFSRLLSADRHDGADLATVKDVVHGKKDVAIPPGFDKDPEAQHVQEIAEKLANFVIETDTDTTSVPTDTENSSLPTESEMDTEGAETDHESGDSVIDRTEVEERRVARTLHVLSSEGLLSCVKTHCDWMRCHPHVIATCAQSSQALWSRLSVLLNFIPTEADLCREELTGCEEVQRAVEQARTHDWTPSLPLTEDVHLQVFPPIEDEQRSLNFSPSDRPKLSKQQETILRICSLRRFGYFIAKMKSIQFTYDAEKCMFFGPLQIESQQDEKSAQQQMADAEARRNQLMKDMAQLRLQAEVSQLEGSLTAAAHPASLSPYLVPDASVLCSNLPVVKQLAASARFIVIIPLAVIDHLDVLKKEAAGARDAIRWLEAEFHKGNRYIRAQKYHEKVTTIPHKNLKKRDKDAWRVVQIVDCCRYLGQQSAECDTKGLVSILTNCSPADPKLSLRVKQTLQTAQQEGISVQNAQDFHNKWKDVWKGGKG